MRTRTARAIRFAVFGGLVPALLCVACGRKGEQEQAGSSSGTSERCAASLTRASFMEDVFRPDSVDLKAPADHPLGNIRWVVRDPNGGFVVVCSGGAMGVYHFSRDGQFLSLIGGRGEGPGEYQGVRCVQVDSTGNIYVLDYTLHRISIYSADGEFADSYPVQMRWSDPTVGFILADSQHVALHMPELSLYGDSTVHVYSRKGELLRKFGHTTPGFRLAMQHFPAPTTGPQLAFAGGRYYEGEYVDYGIRVYTRAGRLVRTIGERPLRWRSFADADFSKLPKGGSLSAKVDEAEKQLSRCVTPWYVHMLGKDVLVQWLHYGSNASPDKAWLRFMFYDLQGNCLKNGLTFRFLAEGREEMFLNGDRYGIYQARYPEELMTGARLICWVPKAFVR